VRALTGPVRLAHAERILEAVETPDLEQDRLVPRHAEALADAVDRTSRELAVLVAEGIDRRVDHELRNREPLGEGGQREGRRLVLDDVLAKEGPRPPLRTRDVEVAAPDPGPLLWAGFHEAGRKRVVRQHHVGGELQRGRAGPREGEELLEDLLGQPLLPALEGMVEPRGQRRRATVAG